MDNNNNNAVSVESNGSFISFADYEWSAFLKFISKYTLSIEKGKNAHDKDDKLYKFKATEDSDIDYVAENEDGSHFVKATVENGLLDALFDYGCDLLHLRVAL